MIAATDRHLLAILQRDARTSNTESARQLCMAPFTIWERVRKLETRQPIQRDKARLTPRALDLGLLAFISGRADERLRSFSTGEPLAARPEMQEVHPIASEDGYLVQVRFASTEAVLASLLAVYLIWGSTYLAIHYAVQGAPPFVMLGGRFLIAGGVLCVVLRLRRAAWPTWRHWRLGTPIGGNGMVAWAESQGVPSSLVALVTLIARDAHA